MKSGGLLRALIYISDFSQEGLHSVTKPEKESASPLFLWCRQVALCRCPELGRRGCALGASSQIRGFRAENGQVSRQFVRKVRSQRDLGRQTRKAIGAFPSSWTRWCLLGGLSHLLGNCRGNQPQPWAEESTLLLCPVHEIPLSQEGYSCGEKILNDLNSSSSCNLTLSEMGIEIEK